mmetsp:Transcript_24586/g.38088  ORF Transcript_24586/g.38088 Transcript_24586/m.38088 type:complete len:101 (+) Transcript_24586:113-415(+)
MTWLITDRKLLGGVLRCDVYNLPSLAYILWIPMVVPVLSPNIDEKSASLHKRRGVVVRLASARKAKKRFGESMGPWDRSCSWPLCIHPLHLGSISLNSQS